MGKQYANSNALLTFAQSARARRSFYLVAAPRLRAAAGIRPVPARPPLSRLPNRAAVADSPGVFVVLLRESGHGSMSVSCAQEVALRATS